MTPNSYLIPDKTAETEESIKKSRFITYITHTCGREKAQEFIRSMRQQHPDARHHCWAFIAGSPNDAQQWGFSDDGEPSGTAGKPILARLCGSGIGEVCAIVVRYSGGIKLGTGGLVRAYGGGVGASLAVLETTLRVPQSELQLSCSYDQLNDIQHIVGQHKGAVVETVYGSSLELKLSIPTSQVSLFKDHLINFFKGNIVIASSKIH
ncbi:YigZ family protein [Parendozoicomonas sp. Alg238-R29]|uniref:YigZ family protein n=1 Tax=Parendozoicomonas sp. Alg238-R29 TaxID=2993446 RepID=UPI00248D98A6|nr:YigZ family protein [Parendozoicomonas sp. Alg238-R29]